MSPPFSGAVDDARPEPHASLTASADHARGDRLGTTRRKRLRELLLATEEGLALEDIERLLEAKRSTIIADLEHLRLSFRHQDAMLLMVPPSCTTCGFTFRLEAPKAPSRCPMCKSKALSDPIFKAAMAEG